MKKSLTVVIPAYNEEKNLASALEDIQKALEGLIDDFEIIVVDDGSKDSTAAIARKWGKRDGRFICVTNGQNRGYGYSYRHGVMAARKDFIGVFNGDNDMSWESFRDLVLNIGKADIVSSYTVNIDARPWLRAFLSRSFVILMNALFKMNLKYFNGCFIARRDLLQALTIRSNGLTVLAECKVKLIRQGHSCLEIPAVHVPRKGGRSSALSLKSIRAVVASMVSLYKDVYGRK